MLLWNFQGDVKRFEGSENPVQTLVSLSIKTKQKKKTNYSSESGPDTVEARAGIRGEA